MRTTITKLAAESERIVTHYLDEGEEWEQFGAKQPNRYFAHNDSIIEHCKVCTRTIPGVVAPPSIRTKRMLHLRP